MRPTQQHAASAKLTSTTSTAPSTRPNRLPSAAGAGAAAGTGTTAGVEINTGAIEGAISVTAADIEQLHWYTAATGGAPLVKDVWQAATDHTKAVSFQATQVAAPDATAARVSAFVTAATVAGSVLPGRDVGGAGPGSGGEGVSDRTTGTWLGGTRPLGVLLPAKPGPDTVTVVCTTGATTRGGRVDPAAAADGSTGSRAAANGEATGAHTVTTTEADTPAATLELLLLVAFVASTPIAAMAGWADGNVTITLPDEAPMPLLVAGSKPGETNVSPGTAGTLRAATVCAANPVDTCTEIGAWPSTAPTSKPAAESAASAEAGTLHERNPPNPTRQDHTTH